VAFFLEHNVFLSGFEEKGQVDWGVVWHPLYDQSRGHPAFLNGTPPVLTVDDALGEVNDLASDATTYYQAVLGYAQGTPEAKLIAWPQYCTLQSVSGGASGQTFVVGIPLQQCRACPTQRELKVAFMFDGVGRYLGRTQLYEARISAFGFSPIGGTVTTDDGSGGNLVGLKGMCAGSATGRCQQVFFFHNGEYLGTDTLSPSPGIPDVQYAGVAKIAVTYVNYAPSDPGCCPSLAPVTITYSWDGTQLKASGVPPGH